MFQKYIKFCSANTFELAVLKSHGLSVYKSIFSKKGHLGVIEKFVSDELTKLINSINKNNRIDRTIFSRSFSYIKTRINQSLKSFSQVYHKLAQQNMSDKYTQDNSGISSAQIQIMLNNIIHSYTMIKDIPEQYVHVISKDTIPVEIAKDFIDTFIKTYHSDKTFQKMILQFYTQMFKLFLNYIDQICDVKFLVILYKITVLKNGSPEFIAFKQQIDDIIYYVIKRSNQDYSRYITRANISMFRKFVLRFFYYIYMKSSLCH